MWALCVYYQYQIATLCFLTGGYMRGRAPHELCIQLCGALEHTSVAASASVAA
jgi:hypothetical protein